MNAQTSVLTQHNDVGRTGLNPTETILTSQNVNVNTFGKLYSIPIDGQAYAQPLYMSNLAINGTNHSVLFVATEHDSVFAFDTKAQGAILWQASMTSAAHGAAAGATSDPQSDTGCADVAGPEYGIKSTPVIDPSTNTLYTTSRTLENGQVVWRFHALDVTTGGEKFGGPVVITGSTAGSAPDAVNGTVTFNSKMHNQRPGLLLLNGVVYAAFGSVCDFSPWHGWVMGYNASTLQQATVFNTTPNNNAGGVWMSGTGLAADTENGVSRIFLTTGNGGFDATAPYGTNSMDFSDSIVALTQTSTGGLNVTDDFTPSDQSYLQQQDLDLSAGGVMVLPDNLPGSSKPHLLVQLGKAGSLVLANRDNLGGYSPTADSDVQELQAAPLFGLYGTPAYWNGNIYFWPSDDNNMKQYTITNGMLSTAPVAVGPIYEGALHPYFFNNFFQGTTASVSSNGNTSPIVWANDHVTYYGSPVEYLDAYDGTNVANLLWSSSQYPGRDFAGRSQKWAVPTIADGRVYVASAGYIQVYGLLAPDFWLTAGQTLVSIPPTSSANIPITVNNQGGFTAPVNLSVSGLPTGVTGTIANGVLTLTASANAPATPGGATVVVTASSGSLTHSASIVLNVMTPPSGSLVNTPLNLSSSYNVAAMNTDGVVPYGGGIDGDGYALSAKLIGSALIYNGVPYAFGPANVYDGVTSAVIPIPAGAGTVGPFNFLASSGGGTSQVFTLTYTDGTTSTFTQSMSNWGYPGNYAGEANALSTAYRITPSGATQTGPWEIYQYSIPLTSGKVLSSVTLPTNGNVVVLAATLPTLLPSQSITFNSIASQFVNTSLGLTAMASSGLAVTYTSSTTSVCTVSASTATMVAAGTCTITATQAGSNTYAAATPVTQSFVVGIAGVAQVNLSAVDNVYAIFNNGVAPTNGGFDGASYAYSESLLGTSLTALGVPFTLGSAGAADAVSSTTVSIPSGSFTSLNFLAAGAFGNFTNQSFSITFTDNTTNTYTQSISDWCTPQSYYGETIALSTTYRVSPGGSTQSLTCDLYAYSFPIPSGKTVKSFTLPASRNIVVLAITMGVSPIAATPTVSPASGAYASGQVVTLTDSTPGASIYYTTNGSAPTSASTLYASPITVSASETVGAVAVAAGYGNSVIAYSAYTINGPAAAPNFSVPGGSYTSAQTVTLSDTTPGAKIYYTTNGTTPTTASMLYSAPITVSTSETINALAAAANYGNSALSTATYSITAASAATSVNLSSAFNTYGIFNSGTAPTHGGLDSTSYAFAGSTLPTGTMLGGAPVTFGPVAAPDAITNATVALPKGQYGSISLLAAASYGPLLNQTFVVTYSDATTASFTQNMSDWGNPQKYSGETTVVSDSQRIIPSGALQAGPWYMYGYTFALNSAKTVSSITLPARGNVFVLAVTLTPASH